MTTIRAHFDGRQVILDEPAPADLKADTPVKVVIDTGQAIDVLAEISKLAAAGGLPADYSAQHEHYVKGSPRR